MNKSSIKAIWIALTLCFALTTSTWAQGGRTVVVITAEGPVTPVMVGYIQRAITTANERGAQALIIRLNTPGGQIDLMDRIVTSMLESPVPVVVYVSPRGAIAGSAGTVITLAAHANAMAPETAIGAASPVGSQGEDINETLDAKIKNILKAQVRNLASERGEEAIALAESTIEEAKAATADEAKAVGLTDFIATDLDDLLRQLDGFTVNVRGESVTLHTADAAVVELEVNLLEEILGILTNPNIVFLLLAVGAQAILIELSSPGGWVAGFTGIVCLALAFYGLGVLPVNWFGIVFIIIAFVLFIMDINAPTHGALTAAAVGSLIVGALILFNSPGSMPYLRVSVPLVIGTSVLLGGAFFVVLIYALKARKLPVAIGVETLVGKVGHVTQTLNPRGIVQLEAEEWSAESVGGTIEVGQSVEVVEVTGVRLRVRKK
ncbi:MAG TPA: nodulation protein NfeD [Anaerolineales bacterium]|nr:nodulation protein NfeD [Anaerolineales bacterium]